MRQQKAALRTLDKKRLQSPPCVIPVPPSLVLPKVEWAGTQSRTSLWIAIGAIVVLVAILAVILTGNLDHRVDIQGDAVAVRRSTASAPVIGSCCCC
jgi:hypothetical protein